jgi:hypothetical protein
VNVLDDVAEGDHVKALRLTRQHFDAAFMYEQALTRRIPHGRRIGLHTHNLPAALTCFTEERASSATYIK